MPTIYLAADHRGHELKERIQAYLMERGTVAVDLTPRLQEGDDYPRVAEVLVGALREAPEARGILACGSGAGIAIAANRFKGVRAAVGMSAAHVSAARHDDDINVLVLAADFIEDDTERQMTDAFVDGAFSPEERYQRRIAELDELGA